MNKKIFVNLIFIIGVLILLYPFVSKLISIKNETIAISNYDKKISNMEEHEKNELNEQLIKYNENLYKSKTIYDENEENLDKSKENSEDELEASKQEMDTANFYPKGEILSYITIPKININIPIYEGTSNSVLEMGIGHLENTSFPTGGINTHSVLVGHSGLATKELFNSLDKLEKDDVFYIRNLDIFLKYKIINIEVVKPDEVDLLEIKDDEDLVTLVTCTPKYINTHRLLVTGAREEIKREDEIKIEDTKNKIEKKKALIEKVFSKKVIVEVGIIISIILIIIAIKTLNKKKKLSR